jgi:hypothetical protein
VPSTPAALRALRSRLPASALGWVQLACGVLAAAVVLAMVVYVLRPVFSDPHGYGGHDWDAMESHRYLVQKAIRRFHEFPFWNPYACGGHPAWGGFEGDTVVVAPWMPAYLALSLPVATRVEIVASALWGALGTWLLASRFTRSPAARAFVVVVFAVNGRWALQLAAGHVWHLVYAWLPWSLFLFDRAVGAQPALGPPRPRDAVWLGVCFAMMVYTGGIHPLPQTVVALGAYALILAIATQSARPLGVLALSTAVGVGLSAPKLLPIVEVMQRYARAIDSRESLDLVQLAQLLTNREQPFSVSHAGIAPLTWHEVGMYVGTPALALIVVGVVAARGARARTLAAIGIVFVALALGSFSPYSPWALVHRLPILRSQDVPYRWLYPAVLLLACVAVAAGERLLVRAGRVRPFLEVAALAVVAWMAKDVGAVARLGLEDPMRVAGPKSPESTGPFHVEQRLPRELDYQSGEHAPTTLSAEIANIGTIECNTFDGLNNSGGLAHAVTGYEGRPSGLGAHGVGEAGYRGEAYLVDGVGTATVVGWTPSSVDVRVDGARPGELVVVNQNWDPGWSVDGERAIDHEATVAARVAVPAQTLHFRYRPRTLWLGLATFAITVAAIILYARARARSRRAARAGPAPPT